ncbi:MAG TPA: hypothetical protein GXX51_11370 [Firmicutes bacterium]|nr:hypothetical protein [Bacillota bacterium]
MGRNDKIKRILEFVKEHKESQATRIVCGRILGRYDAEISDENLVELREGLRKAGDDDIDSLYVIIS